MSKVKQINKLIIIFLLSGVCLLIITGCLTNNMDEKRCERNTDCLSYLLEDREPDPVIIECEIADNVKLNDLRDIIDIISRMPDFLKPVKLRMMNIWPEGRDYIHGVECLIDNELVSLVRTPDGKWQVVGSRSCLIIIN